MSEPSTKQRPHTLRRPLTYATLWTASLCLIGLAVTRLVWGDLSGFLDTWKNLGRHEGADASHPPDFGLYKQLRTLHEDEFPIDNPRRRTIIVGDIHGMYSYFQDLLEHVNYSPSTDVLIHAGDITAKGPLEGSLETLQFMTRHNITGVRGNHDQKVIEWRAWINWLETLPGGEEWLSNLEKAWERASEEDEVLKPKKFFKRQRKQAPLRYKKFFDSVPKEWAMLGPHFEVARGMSPQEFEYLSNLPLRLYIPHAHSFIAHAGLLPSDPRYPDTDKERQPLARQPKFDRRPSHPDLHMESLAEDNEKTIEGLRYLQEVSVLTEIPQNLDPWVLLNMRSVLADGEVSRKNDEGVPWSDIWKREMTSCTGFKGELASEGLLSEEQELSCYPSTIIYGHAATRGLDLKRWSLGLDSACVREGRLSALVIGGEDNLSHTDDVFVAEDVTNDYYKHYLTPDRILKQKADQIFRFGDHSRARISSVRCKH